MAYTEINFKTKKALREAFNEGKQIKVYQPGPFGPVVQDGTIALEGPHYPLAHTWYATVEIKDGIITSVKG